MRKTLTKTWDYDSAVAELKPLVVSWQKKTLEIVRLLYRANQELANPGYRSDLTEECKASLPTSCQMAQGSNEILTLDPPQTFVDFCEDIGLPKRTVYNWLALYDAKEDRLLTKDEAKERALEEERLRLQEGEADELGRWMKEARRRLERLVKDVSTGQLTKEKTRAVKDFIASMEDEGTRAQELVEEGRARRRQAVRTDYEVGQEVLCGSFHRRGTILRVLGKGRYQVSIDSMKFDLGAEDIQLAPVEGKARVATFASRTPAPSLMLDVRGMRLEAAIEAVDDEIEACLVHSLSTFSIIHGYGNGILSQGIHAHLKKLRSVKEYYFARPEDGGMGKTYVTLAD